MENPSLQNVGPSRDMETRYARIYESVVQTPRNRYIPFNKQGFPLPDPLQHHTDALQTKIACTDTQHNPIPFYVWHGIFDRQINQPDFLSINTRRYN